MAIAVIALHPGAARDVATPTRLGAASQFSQGAMPRMMLAARSMPVLRLRDSIRWADVERRKGHYAFATPTADWPDRTGDRRMRFTLTLNWGNPLYDNGDTPHSAEAAAAFGRFAAAVVTRFPGVDTLEIGNEINGDDFVKGPVRQAGPGRRAAYHLAMVQAASESVHAVRPDVVILGGSTHSIPLHFLQLLAEYPGSAALQGLALHPYSSPIDQLPAQIGMLRRSPALARLPLHVTEWGSLDARRAADDLLRAYATLSALGAAEFDWYPLSPRGDGFVPLLAPDAGLTDAGKAFRFASNHLANWPARNESPDALTFRYAFGPSALVLWGAARPIAIDPELAQAFDATGAPLDPASLRLSPDRAITVIAHQGIAPASVVKLGCTPLIADTFYQFGYPLPGAQQAQGDPFVRLALANGNERPLEARPGQERPDVPWTPYLGLSANPMLRLSAERMVIPAGNAIIHRVPLLRSGPIRLKGRVTPKPGTRDDIEVQVTLSGQEVFRAHSSAEVALDLPLRVRSGQTIDLSVKAAAQTAVAAYRFTVLAPNDCPE